MAMRKKKAGVLKRKTPAKKKKGKLRPPWKKGQSGNPGGRPRLDAELRDAAREYTQEALNVLVNGLKSKSAAVKIKCAQELLDRGWGKPRQSVEISDPDGNPVATRIEVVYIKPDGSIGDGKG